MEILIVDDEPLIHRSIEFMIHELHFRNMYLFHAKNASEMEQLLRKHSIDLALVDIKMPGPSGLSAITKAKGFSPDTLYFIMSGYSEFDYARKAITLGVEDYLLKPLDSSTLRKVITAAKEKQEVLLKRHRDVLRYWLRDVAAKSECVDLLPEGETLAAVYMTVENCNDTQSDLVPNLHDRFGNQMVSCPAQDGILVLLFSHHREKLEEMLSVAKDIPLSKQTTLYFTPPCSDSALLKRMILKLIDDSPARVLFGIGRHYSSDELENGEEDVLLKYAHNCLLWRDNYYSGSCLEYISSCMAIYSPLENGTISPNYHKNIFQYIGTVLGIQDLKQLSLKTVRSVLETAGDSMIKRENMDDRMDTLVQYINENFCTNLSIATLSEHFGLTPNYLSTLLNHKLGKKFADYLADLRIGYAKELLAGTKMPVKNIMEKVGYYSPSHFNKLFVKHEGITPSSYRKKAEDA